ncbi:hypothetical protein [Miniphocaeibacter halophilus]|uniref:Uncharacterized protein n=1 Tax=Miniphocaeibacter halophilus TaxID=2931922 RepID=A0AC61MQ15_9FIRM|nr:hypothetical protein [Miniphocaeibacter halophilus]QQK07722.1 hypothetical protein JFY71_10605 [Miniphocaeibacter halophilus]
MSKKKSKLERTQELTELAIKKTNKKIDELGFYTSQIYDELNTIQKIFDDIRNVPSEEWLKYEELKKIRLNWKQQAEKIETDYKNTVAKNAGKGAAGVGIGVAFAALGPTAAMGIATTFGIASTGTAISTLSGAAATNAALAWLGGGALAAGGGGITAGSIIMNLFSPIGWMISGTALASSGFLLWKGKNDRNRLENIFILISKRDVKSFELAIVEINERITRIKDEVQKLNNAIERIKEFGLDYNLMPEDIQYELGSYVNLMNSSTQLLINPILGLQSKYTEDDFKTYNSFDKNKVDDRLRSLIIYLANLLYKITLDDKDKTLLWKSFKRNKEFLKLVEISKKDFDFSIIETVTDALQQKYHSEKN